MSRSRCTINLNRDIKIKLIISQRSQPWSILIPSRCASPTSRICSRRSFTSLYPHLRLLSKYQHHDRRRRHKNAPLAHWQILPQLTGPGYYYYAGLTTSSWFESHRGSSTLAGLDLCRSNDHESCYCPLIYGFYHLGLVYQTCFSGYMFTKGKLEVYHNT